MIDFSSETFILENSIRDMREILKLNFASLTRKQLRPIIDRLVQIEDDVYYIDDLMPLREFGIKFTEPGDKAAFEHVLDLLEEAFGLLDEILGPPEEAEDEAPLEGESEGNPLDALLKGVKPGRHVS